jgi:hypothetical protein
MTSAQSRMDLAECCQEPESVKPRRPTPSKTRCLVTGRGWDRTLSGRRAHRTTHGQTCAITLDETHALHGLPL